MAKRKNKFKSIWKNQKELGLIYGQSAIAVGKALVELGLKDPDSKEATQISLEEGFAKSTPLGDGTPFFLWHKQKVCQDLDHLEGWSRQSQEERDLQKWTSEYISSVKKALKADEKGEHHVIVEGFYDEARSCAKRIKKRGAKFVDQANQLIAKKLDDSYLLQIKDESKSRE